MTRRIKIILFIAIWLGLIAYLVLSLSYSAQRADEVVCKRVSINITDSSDYRFVTPKIVRQKLTQSGLMPLGIPMHSIDLHTLEQQVAQMMAVREVQVYASNDGVLRIDIKQRQPIVRIFNANGVSYYVDSQGLIMPSMPNFTAHVLVVSGNIKEPFVPRANVNVMHWNDSLQGNKRPLICQLLELASHIVDDEFWRAQVEQIHVATPTDIRLIPTVGPHTILLGNAEGYDRKLRKLRKFYSDALPHEGWNTYRTINLKYSNQIICTKW